MEIEPYIPVYFRPPNKFLRYEDRRFDVGNGKSGTERVAIFRSKNGTEQEMTAQIIWDT